MPPLETHTPLWTKSTIALSCASFQQLSNFIWQKQARHSHWWFPHPHCSTMLHDYTVFPTPWFTGGIGLLWSRLQQVKKLLGGWPKIGLLFICPPAAALFSSNLPVSCQFRGFLSLSVSMQEHSFHQFQGLRCPGEQSILIIHFMQNSTI